MANITQNLCRNNLQRFWLKEIWSPWSPARRESDGLFHMFSSRGEHLQDRKVSVERAWSNILQNIMHAALEDVRMRLQEVIPKKKRPCIMTLLYYPLRLIMYSYIFGISKIELIFWWKIDFRIIPYLWLTLFILCIHI